MTKERYKYMFANRILRANTIRYQRHIYDMQIILTQKHTCYILLLFCKIYQLDTMQNVCLILRESHEIFAPKFVIYNISFSKYSNKFCNKYNILCEEALVQTAVIHFNLHSCSKRNRRKIYHCCSHINLVSHQKDFIFGYILHESKVHVGQSPLY